MNLGAFIQAYLAQKFGRERPVLAVVEPTRAACYFASMASRTGRPVKIKGEMDTIMAGLACGEPSSLAWLFLIGPSETVDPTRQTNEIGL